MLRTQYSSILLTYLFAPAAPCSYSLPVSAAPAVPLAIPFFLAISAASSGLVPVCPGSVILSVISLLTAVGSCSFSFAGVIASFSLYSFSGSSFLPFSVPGAPSSYSEVCSPLVVSEERRSLASITLSLTLSLISLILSEYRTLYY